MCDYHPLPPLWRVAEAIRRRLLVQARNRIGQVGTEIDKLIEPLVALQKVRRGLSVCQQRLWPAAARTLTSRIETAVRNVPFLIDQVCRVNRDSVSTVPSLRELHADLLQLTEEFEMVRYDGKHQRLAVATDPIELDGIFLGDFEIRLHIPTLSEVAAPFPYTVGALDPHPAASNEYVTHPHVSEEILCAGDALAPIRSALSAGRICDFFMLVRSVLTTYNSDSPYVPLKDWHGRPCHDCGYITGGDDVQWCTSCERNYCDDCSSYCRCCDETTCNDCLESCPECNASTCTGCMTTCPECDKRRCRSCAEEPCPCQHEDDGEDNHEQDDPKQAPDRKNPHDQSRTINIIRTGTYAPAAGQLATTGAG